MKKLFFISILSISSLFTFASTVPTGQVFTEIISAFRAGNANVLSGHFDTKVEIAVLESDEVYSKADAEKIMNRFFSDYKPSSFSKEHEGTSPSGANYFIGILKTTKGSYRVFIHAKQVNGKKIIQQIQIEEE
jgi:hypothetical protein